RSRNPTVLTRSSSPSSAKQTFVRAVSSLATVTTRKTAARDRGASMLCASIGTLSQFFVDIANAPRFSKLQTPYVSGRDRSTREHVSGSELGIAVAEYGITGQHDLPHSLGKDRGPA